MNQFRAAFYELRCEVNWKSIRKSLCILLALVLIALYSTKDMFFTNYASTFSGIFTLTMALFWVGLFNSITVICRIRPRIKVQVVQGLSVSYYICAHVFFQLIKSFLQSLIVTLIVWLFCICNLIKNCPTEGVTFCFWVEFLIFAFLVIFSADMLGLAISAFCSNEKSAMTAMPMFLIAEMVLSNALFPLPKVASWASMFMVSRWGTDLFGTICNVRSYCSLEEQAIKPLQTELPEILCTYSNTHMTVCIMALIALSITCILTAYLFLHHIKKESLL